MRLVGPSGFVALAVGLCLSSCVDLQKVGTYSTAASGTMKNKAVSEGIPATISRRLSYRSQQSPDLAKEAESNGKRLAAIQDAYDKYFLALGALSSKDLTNYKTQFDLFEKSVTGSEVVTKSESTAIRKLAQGLTTLAAERYRQNEIHTVVATVDPPLQRGMRNLQNLNAKYRESLAREDVESKSALDETLTANQLQKPPLPPYLAMSLRNQQVAAIQAEMKKSQAFDKAVDAIAKGHKVILRDSKNVRGKEAFEALKPHVQDILDGYKELSK